MPTDGPSIVIDGHGFLWEASGLQYGGDGADPRSGTNCDMDVFKSSIGETGGAWTPTFEQKGYFVTDQYTNDHLLLAFPDGGNPVGAFPESEQSNDPLDFNTVAWMPDVGTWDGVSRATPWDTSKRQTVIFDPGGLEFTNEWALCGVGPNEIYALRHIESEIGTFDSERWNGTTWVALTAPPQRSAAVEALELRVGGRGLVILGDGDATHGLFAFTIAQDGATIISSKLATATATWSDWTTVGPAPAAPDGERHWLAGTGCGRAHPALLRTEVTGPTTSVVAMDVSPLFAP